MRLLVAHPNQRLREEISETLGYDGFDVVTAATLHDAEQALRIRTFDCCLVGGRMPDGSILDFYPTLNRKAHLPTIVLAGNPSMRELILFLECGFSDVMRSPYDPEEIKARIRARVREHYHEETPPDPFQIQVGPFTLDLVHHVVEHQNQRVRLTCTEIEIFLLLLKAQGRVLSREEIFTNLETEAGELHPRRIDSYIRRLRDKLSFLGLEDTIETKWGEGYYFLPLVPILTRRSKESKE